MGSGAPLAYVDYDTYLAIERETDQKHEWFDGQVYAMAGGTLVHSQRSARVIVELGLLARARGWTARAIASGSHGVLDAEGHWMLYPRERRASGVRGAPVTAGGRYGERRRSAIGSPP